MKWFSFIIGFFISLSLSAQDKDTPTIKNVLFVMIDDFRLQAGVYGNEEMITPTMDKLGDEAVVFNRAYCQVPTCGASRVSMLTGLYPTKDRFLNYQSSHDVDAPDVPGLGMWLKSNGFTTRSIGKIYHSMNDELEAWSSAPTRPKSKNSKGLDYLTTEAHELLSKGEKHGPAYEMADVGDYEYTDGLVVKEAIDVLKELAEDDAPFFLAVGLKKPHLPFNAPKKYWDMYDRASIQLADNPWTPVNAPINGIYKSPSNPDVFYSTELRPYKGIPEEGQVDDELAKTLKHGYFACVTYADKLIGDLFDELERLQLEENTVVVVVSDHGFHLGEHGFWGKHCTYNTTLNTPLIIKAPGKKQGVKTEAITELIDIYPTICDLVGVDQPDHLQGKSFTSVLSDPTIRHKNGAYSRYIRGETLTTDQYIFTEYTDWKGDHLSYMMYDLINDPKENINIADLPENDSITNVLKASLELYQKEEFDKITHPSDTSSNPKDEVLSTRINDGSLVLVYPNPFKDKITLKGINGPVNYSLMSIHGNVLRAGITDSDKVLNVASLSQGVYYLQLTTAERRHVVKLIKR